jgi:NTP pyrophosphatase (non-canonical NTP hydrolase)
MNYRWAQQEVDTWVSQYKIAYFKPLEILAQTTEEVGELSEAIIKEDQDNIGEELAGIAFTILCMANSHQFALKESYAPVAITGKSFLYLTSSIGQLAREINHLYGPKKKKTTEETADVLQRLEQICANLDAVAKANNINLAARFTDHMNKLYDRDTNRWEKK